MTRFQNTSQEFPRWADGITIEDLLHHTSALPEYVNIFEKLWPQAKGWYTKALEEPDDWYPEMPNGQMKEISNKHVLEWLAARKRVRTPDTEYGYSNTGYVLLAELVERVSETPFSDYIGCVAFGISGDVMRSTYVFDEVYRFLPGDPETARHARCYNRVKGRFVPVGYTPLNFITGDGNVHSTIRDGKVGEVPAHVGLPPAGAGAFMVTRTNQGSEEWTTALAGN